MSEDAEKSGAVVKDSARLYPYPIPQGYLDATPYEGAPPPAIGNGIYLAIAEDFDGAAKIHYPEMLSALGTRGEVLRLAQVNLARALGEGRVTIRGFEGPRGARVIVFGFEWLAASCLLLHDLHTFATSALGEGPLLACIPHRECMMVFRDLDPAYRAEMRTFIEANEKDGRKPLTFDFFHVTPSGIEALR